MNFNPIQSITSTIQAGVNTALTAVGNVTAVAGLLSGASDASGAWPSKARPASYRGVPFAVLSGQGQFGRRNAVHVYPYRDKAWVEDLGRDPRRIRLSCFLVENAKYGGIGGVIAQREKLIAACETPGDGELIHPTLGRMTVSNMSLEIEENWDRRRVFEFTISFVEAGARVFPAVVQSTGAAVMAAAKMADAAAKKDFLSTVTDAIKKGAAVVSQVVSTAAKWGRMAQSLANDATNLYNMVGSLKGGFGRFFSKGGIANIAVAGASIVGGGSSLSGLIALGSVARAGVGSAITSMISVASGLGS